MSHSNSDSKPLLALLQDNGFSQWHPFLVLYAAPRNRSQAVDYRSALEWCTGLVDLILQILWQQPRNQLAAAAGGLSFLTLLPSGPSCPTQKLLLHC